MTLRMRGGGEGGRLLVMLHGLGGTGEVWRAVAQRWPGRWLAPDLPGHGGSEPLPRYSFGALAAAVAAEIESAEPIAVLGHSLGGVVALTLGTGWFGAPVAAVCGLGIKVRWSDDELARARELARRPVQVFAERDDAMRRALKVAGLPGDPPVDGLVRSAGSGWRLSLDPAAFAVGAPDLPGLLAAARADVVLAAGEHDPMSPAEHLAALSADHVMLAGLGHSAHVEDPAAVDPLLDRLAR